MKSFKPIDNIFTPTQARFFDPATPGRIANYSRHAYREATGGAISNAVNRDEEKRTHRVKEETREEPITRDLDTMSDSEGEDYGMGEALPEAGIEGRRVMPLRHDKGALSYAGGPVGRYLRDMEDLVKRCGGGENHKLYYAAYYCDDRHEKLFTGIYRRLKLADKSWKGFKKAALAQLEGSDGRGRLYTLEMAKEMVADRKSVV